MSHFIRCSLAVLVLWNVPACGQHNVIGKPGYILAPSAAETTGPLQLTTSWMPPAMSFGDNTNTLGSDKGTMLYHAGVSLTRFFQVNLNITYGISRARTGIGDRQIDARIQVLRERKYRPALVLILCPPGATTNYLAHNVAIATKRFSLFKQETVSENAIPAAGTLEVSVGYGSPYYLRGLSLIDKKSFTFYDKRELGNWYLVGGFAGISFRPASWLLVSAEVTNKTAAAGMGLNWKNRLSGKLNWFGRDVAGISAQWNISLENKPFELRKRAKKNP